MLNARIRGISAPQEATSSRDETAGRQARCQSGRSHVIDAVLDGDLGEGDAGGGGVAGGKHAGKVDGSVAEFEVELVHGGAELGAVAGFFEEGLGDFGVGEEVAEGDAHEKGFLVLGAVGALRPRGAEDFEKGEGVLGRAEAGLHAPGSLGDAGGVLFHFGFGARGRGLLAGEGVLDGHGQGGGVEVFHAEAHGGFVKEFVSDGPGAFRGAMVGAEDVAVAEGFLEIGGDGSAVVARVVAAEPMVEPIAPDGVPEFVHAGAVEGEEVRHGVDALGIEAGFGAGAYAGQVAEFEVGDGAREL